MKMAECGEGCKVQLVPNSRLHKYIQVEGNDEMEGAIQTGSGPFNFIEIDFAESMANVKISSTNGHGYLRLMNLFSAKTRWDVMMEGKDLKEVATLAGAHPSNRRSAHGRRYLHKACEALDKGSVSN